MVGPIGDLHTGVGKIGAQRIYSNTFDGAFIDMTAEAQASARLAHVFTNGNAEHAIRRVGTREGTVLGWVVCRTGHNSFGQFPSNQQTTCGEHIANNITRGRFQSLGLVEHTGGCPGDSGGPWWRERDNAALGIHHGGTRAEKCPDDFVNGLEEDSYFAFVSDINSALGTTVHTK